MVEHNMAGAADPVHGLGPARVVAPIQCPHLTTWHSPSHQDATPMGLCVSSPAAPLPMATPCRLSTGLPAHGRKTKSGEGYRRRK